MSVDSSTTAASRSETARNKPSVAQRIMRIPATLDRLLYKTMQWLLIFPIKVYQITLSPLIGRQCRHYPTCSHYAIEAIERHGPVYGFWLAFWRIMRCNPFFRGGVDPVPPVPRAATEKESGKQT